MVHTISSIMEELGCTRSMVVHFRNVLRKRKLLRDKQPISDKQLEVLRGVLVQRPSSNISIENITHRLLDSMESEDLKEGSNSVEVYKIIERSKRARRITTTTIKSPKDTYQYDLLVNTLLPTLGLTKQMEEYAVLYSIEFSEGFYYLLNYSTNKVNLYSALFDAPLSDGECTLISTHQFQGSLKEQLGK